jgi:hypothetical protein
MNERQWEKMRQKRPKGSVLNGQMSVKSSASTDLTLGLEAPCEKSQNVKRLTNGEAVSDGEGAE